MKWILVILAAAGFLFGAVNGTMDAVAQSGLSESSKTISLVLTLAGGMCLWSGLLQIAKDSGLTDLIARLLHPIISLVFRGVALTARARELICINMTANLLGLGNAATPAGVAAMKELADGNHPERASDGMILLTVLNTASIQLIPTTVAMLRLRHGAQNPFDILPAVLIVSFSSAAIVVCLVRLCNRIRRKIRERKERAA